MYLQLIYAIHSRVVKKDLPVGPFANKFAFITVKDHYFKDLA